MGVREGDLYGCAGRGTYGYEGKRICMDVRGGRPIGMRGGGIGLHWWEGCDKFTVR